LNSLSGLWGEFIGCFARSNRAAINTIHLMIALFTDFGSDGPYTRQIKAVLWSPAPGQPVIDLFADVPPSNAKAAAYLLASYCPGLTGVEILLCVVDPGVGSARRALCVEAGGQ
jgi:S-adenosyl-L-methionine hydrolase (adenosine-forming)